MKRITVIAKGEVQRVNYREEVQRIARKLGIVGYVENLKPYDVRIVAEGEEDRLKQFLELIKIKRFPIFVEELEVSWENATGEFKYFEIRRGDWKEELFERLDTAGKLLYRSVELSEKSVQLSEKSVQLGEKSVAIGEETLKAIKEESEKTRKELGGIIREESEKTRVELGTKIDNLGAKIDSAKGEIAEKIDLLRMDLREYIEANLKEIHSKISEIEKALKKAGIM